MIGIGDQAREQIHQKVETTAVSGMLNLADVLELVIDQFNTRLGRLF
jgi:hypothetical protein